MVVFALNTEEGENASSALNVERRRGDEADAKWGIQVAVITAKIRAINDPEKWKS